MTDGPKFAVGDLVEVSYVDGSGPVEDLWRVPRVVADEPVRYRGVVIAVVPQLKVQVTDPGSGTVGAGYVVAPYSHHAAWPVTVVLVTTTPRVRLGAATAFVRGERVRCKVEPVMAVPAGTRAPRSGVPRLKPVAMVRFCRPRIWGVRATPGFRGRWEWVTRCHEHDTTIAPGTWADALGEAAKHQLEYATGEVTAR